MDFSAITDSGRMAATVKVDEEFSLFFFLQDLDSGI